MTATAEVLSPPSSVPLQSSGPTVEQIGTGITQLRRRNDDAEAAEQTGFSPAPQRRRYDDKLEALNIRRVARLNAASIKQSEVDALLRERAELIEKRFGEGLSRADERRLAFVRWSLDRIHDAKHGQSLDVLESAVARYENFSSDIHSLMHELERVGGTKVLR
jgi:hypothetical protein